jgi:hypothetical protein
MNESPLLVHVWDVDPAAAAAAESRLSEMFGELLKDPGFVSARILESTDRTSIAALVEMRSVEDRQRLERLPEVREVFDHLDGTANIVIRLYHEGATYHA